MKIVLGQLKPGSAISVTRLTEELTVSAAPVRDALIRLSERGMIEHHEGRGFFVQPVSMQSCVASIALLCTLASENLQARQRTGPIEIEQVIDQADIGTAYRVLQANFEKLCVVVYSDTTVQVTRHIQHRLSPLWQLTLSDPEKIRKMERSQALAARCLATGKHRKTLSLLKRWRQHLQVENSSFGA